MVAIVLKGVTMGEKVFSQTKANMQHHMDILQSRLAKLQGADSRAEAAERSMRDMAREQMKSREMFHKLLGEQAAEVTKLRKLLMATRNYVDRDHHGLLREIDDALK